MSSAATGTALSKTPNEIWFKIFRLVIRPVPFEWTQHSVERVFIRFMLDNPMEILGAYTLSEQKRHRLMLVCTSWKTLADALDPRIVFSARIGNEDCIFPYRHHIEYQRTLPDDSKALTRTRNRAHDFRMLFHSRPWHGFLVTQNIHGGSRAITVVACYSRDLLEADYANVHVLSILWAYKSSQTIHMMREPAFQHLLVLYLYISGYISPSIIPEAHLILPQLLSFQIRSICSIQRATMNISEWQFPKLVAFEADFLDLGVGFMEELLEFLQRNGTNLKVLNISGYCRVQKGLVWEHLTHLEYSQVNLSLGTLAEELPALRRRSIVAYVQSSTRGSGHLEPPIPLRLAIDHRVQKDTKSRLKETFLRYGDVFTDIILVFSEYRWTNDTSLSEEEIEWRQCTYGLGWNKLPIADWVVNTSPLLLDGFRDFLDVVEQADLPVEDAVGTPLTHPMITDIREMLEKRLEP